MDSPFKGVVHDFKGRKSCYKQDWDATFRIGLGILAPTTYIFFVYALLVIAFEAQLRKETASTAICNIMHSIFGEQPLFILGVAKPTSIMYFYLYSFAKRRHDLGKELFLAWAGWVCVWTTFLLILLAIFNACVIINKFTRIAGELFGMLIDVLFMQQAIKGIVSEFEVLDDENSNFEKYNFQWLYLDGLLGVIFTFGLLFTALKSRGARSWRYGTSCLKPISTDASFIVDY